MTMSNADICLEYKQAKNKANQVTVLADLNQCTRKEILDILEAEGVTIDKRLRGHPKAAKKTAGEKAARLAGKRMGHPPKPLPVGFEEAAKRWADGEISSRKAAFSCGMTPGNFRYHALKWRESYESTQIQAPR